MRLLTAGTSRQSATSSHRKMSVTSKTRVGHFEANATPKDARTVQGSPDVASTTRTLPPHFVSRVPGQLLAPNKYPTTLRQYHVNPLLPASVTPRRGKSGATRTLGWNLKAASRIEIATQFCRTAPQSSILGRAQP